MSLQQFLIRLGGTGSRVKTKVKNTASPKGRQENLDLITKELYGKDLGELAIEASEKLAGDLTKTSKELANDADSIEVLKAKVLVNTHKEVATKNKLNAILDNVQK